MIAKEYFISGIDTDCGKTYITGLLACNLNKTSKKIITSKLVQTGCIGISEDIIEHRRLMGIDLLPEDESKQTCPFVFTFPASPHLATEIDKKNIDFSIIRNTIDDLKNNYDLILSEGAGGLMVPITKNYLTIDYIKDYSLPLILVGSSKLGSINHTLLSIDACINKGIQLHTFVYNQFPDNDETIAIDSYNYLKDYLSNISPDTNIIHSKELLKDSNIDILSFFK